MARTMWLLNSPELNPVDYAIWGIFEQNLYDGQQFETIEQLKERMHFVWNNFEQGVINGAINLWRRRLQEVVNNNGGHIHNILV